MNENYYNGKYNVIKPNMSLVDETFKIRKQELDNDEVFFFFFLLKKDFENLDYDKIFSLPLDDNIIYVNAVNYSHIHTECSIDDSIVYCGSFVLWILGNNHRLPQNLFADIRSHRIFPKNIWEALDEL